MVEDFATEFVENKKNHIKFNISGKCIINHNPIQWCKMNLHKSTRFPSDTFCL